MLRFVLSCVAVASFFTAGLYNNIWFLWFGMAVLGLQIVWLVGFWVWYRWNLFWLRIR